MLSVVILPSIADRKHIYLVLYFTFQLFANFKLLYWLYVQLNDDLPTLYETE